ncbi:amino acid adenylation domain-containing protein [Actinomadura sp. 1N219]|uniref:amino acid adenylation domain-containing protein n=1 Tax=Actinomadura sp. 1N219 TaxID=3375152 RepID=UPI00379AD7E6
MPAERQRRLMEAIRRRSDAGSRRIAPAAGPGVPSYFQERMWFLQQFHAGSPVYNIPLAVHLRGRLDLGLMERALTAVVARHRVLRSAIVEDGGGLVTKVHDAAPVPIEVADVDGDPAARADLIAAEASRPFDLGRPPFVRARALRAGDAEHVLLLTFHHAAMDGWSIGIVLRDLAAFYSAFAAGEDGPAEPPALQYADFARWQRAFMDGAEGRAQAEYWHRQLAGAPNVLDLPSDRPRPAVRTYRAGRLYRRIAPGLGRKVAELCRREGVTLYVGLLTALQTTLARMSGQDDIVVGSPFAGRTRPELEDMVGSFVNTLALRADLSGDPTVGEALRRVRDVVFDAHANQGVPFERLVADLRPDRDLSRSVLFQVMFALENEPEGAFEIAGVEARSLPAHTLRSEMDVSLYAYPDSGADGLLLAWTYSRDLFDEESAERIAECFESVLEGLADAPAEARLSEPPLVRGAGLARLREWSDGGEGAGGSVHGPVRERARSAPGRIAVECGDVAVTYGELAARVSRLAAALRARGVRPEEPVGVCVSRSPDLVVALLGVLAAGGAYVPLDPAYPADRLRLMVDDTGLRFVVGEPGVWDERWGPGATVVRPDEPGEPGGPGEHDWADVHPERLAYVIYTSGSTGRPKGVAVRHAAAANLLTGMLGTPGLASGDRILAITPISFDISLVEIFLPLWAGATVVMLPRAEAADPDAIAKAIERHAVSTVQATPSTWRMLLDSGWPGRPGLRMWAGGEALPRDLADRLLGSGGELWNVYGPTETTVWSTVSRVGPGEPVTIGRPMNGQSAFVVDGFGGLVPVGVVGELLLGGVGLARGYVGRGGLTAERFVPDVFGGGGGRLYRTGDLARWRGDGLLELVGRSDFQVKVRGFRVELGEVESAVRAVGGVVDCAVSVQVDGSGAGRLVCHLVGDADVDSVRDSVREVLPDYMVPSVFWRVEALPLTPNGKVDRARLPEISAAEVSEITAPRSAVEEVVAALWCDVLGLASVSVLADFFDVGGHSLAATRLVARLREVFGVVLGVRAVFENRTVAALARHIEQAAPAAGGTPPPAPAARGVPLPLTTAQELMVGRYVKPDPRHAPDLQRELAEHTVAYSIPVILSLRGDLDVPALRAAVAELVQRHEPLRTTFVLDGGEVVQSIAEHADVDLPVEDVPEADLRDVTTREAERPFDLIGGPLARLRLLRVAATDHVLLATFHHSIADGWSVSVFLDELRTAYTARREEEPSPLPPPPLQFADIAVWEREAIRNGSFDEHLAFWRTRMDGAPTSLALPARGTRSRYGVRHPLGVEPDVHAALEEVARKEGATLFMTLLSCFTIMLARQAGTADIVVGAPFARRDLPGTAGLLGFLINILPVRTDLSGDPPVRDVLRRTRDAVLAAHAHQDVPGTLLLRDVPGVEAAMGSAYFSLHRDGHSGARPRWPGLDAAVTYGERREPEAGVMLELELFAGTDGLHGRFLYQRDAFDEAAVQSFADDFAAVCRAVARDPGARLSDLPAPAALPAAVRPR